MKTVVKGKVPSKSNMYKVARKGKFCSFYKSKEVKDYEKSFVDQIGKPSTYDGKFMLKVDVYFANPRSDLDNAMKILLDCLQLTGAIKNDKDCTIILARKYVDKDEPRIEFQIIEDI